MLQNTCSRLRLSANQWTSGSEVGVAEEAEAASGGQGAVTGDVHGSWAQDWEWQTTWNTATVTPRTLKALPTGTYHHLGSVG